MSTPDSSKVAVLEGKVTGAIFIAPTTAVLPTDATTALAATFKCIGFTSEDGITISEESSSKQLRAWEGRSVVRNQRTEYTEKIKFTPVECNEDVAKLMWGDDKVTAGTGGALTIKHHGETLEPVLCVIEAVPYAGAVARYCAKVQLTERGDMTGNGDDPSGRELTFDCIAVEGVTMTEYIASSTPTVASSGK